MPYMMIPNGSIFETSGIYVYSEYVKLGKYYFAGSAVYAYNKEDLDTLFILSYELEKSSESYLRLQVFMDCAKLISVI